MDPSVINKKTEDLIVFYEGERLTSYRDTGGIWTIGVGHTSDEKFKVTKGQTITREFSRELLRHDLKEAENFVNTLVKVPLNENQYGALVSFTFNLGGGSLKISTLLKKLNAGNYKAIPSELNKWVFDDGVKLAGLIKRRKAEGELWNTPTTVPVVAPTVTVRPETASTEARKPVQRIEPTVVPNVPHKEPSESGAFLKVLGAVAAAGAIALGNWLGLF